MKCMDLGLFLSLLLGLVFERFVFFPAVYRQQIAYRILRGEVKRFEFGLPVGPFVAKNKGNFPQAIGR